MYKIYETDVGTKTSLYVIFVENKQYDECSNFKRARFVLSKHIVLHTRLYILTILFTLFKVCKTI